MRVWLPDAKMRLVLCIVVIFAASLLVERVDADSM
jgi:hypothetical protein